MSRPGTSGLMISLAILSSVSAQTVVHVDIDAPPGGGGTSWTTAYDSLSAALAAAQPGDQIWVAAGRYVGNFTLARGVQLYGGFAGTETELDQRDWTINKTILDGDQNGSVVTSPTRATETTRIDGFTITGGNAYHGGGLHLGSSSPTIANNTITGNRASYSGGGVYLSYSDATIANNTITGNTASKYGGGLYLSYSDATIANNTITGNTASNYGGGLYLSYSDATIANDTITSNSAYSGGGLYVEDSSPMIANTIIAFNSSGMHLEDDESAPTHRYNCVYGNTEYDYDGLSDPTGTDGNISQDPLLADAQYGNVHIQPDSPCVDVGSNSGAYGESDLDGEPRIHPVDGIVDIGADESDGTVWPPGPYAVVRVSPLGDDFNDGLSWAQAKCTVQAGVDAASVLGGEVWVQSGSYEENITLRPYAYLYGGFAGDEEVRDDRNWVNNVTVLDGRQRGSVVTATVGNGVVGAIDGFTITGGNARYGGGGGLYLRYSSPTIANNTITGNTANTLAGGGGLYLWYSSPTIVNNTITRNGGSDHGGGLYLGNSSPTIANNTITSNTASHSGGGLFLVSSSPTIANNTITGNSAQYGGGLHLGCSSPTITNTIIAFNSSGVCGYADVSPPVLRHNCVYGNTAYDWYGLDPTGTNGNISQDPLFADARYDNVHIQPDSPCVNAGSNPDSYGDFDVDGEPRIHPVDGIVDIGADESNGTLWPPGPYAVIRVSPLGDDINDGSSWAQAKCTVQAGVDAASALGGEVWVQSGSYEENIILHPYAYLYGGFAGDEEVRDERDWVGNVTILDGRQQGSVVTAKVGNGVVSAIDGFTITAGIASCGGGLYLENSSPTIANNTIMRNSANCGGGGLCLVYSSPTIANNTITGNGGSEHGGGLYLYNSSPTIANNTITSNTAGGFGGGMHLFGSSPMIANNTIMGNNAQPGGGLCLEDSSPTITNTIIAFNSSGVYGCTYRDVTTPILRYNCVHGNTEYNYDGLSDPTGTDGNISQDPLFVRDPDDGGDGWGDDPDTLAIDESANDDYGNLRHLPGSPCIDAADNDAVLNDMLDIDGDGDVTEPIPFDLDGYTRFVDDPRTVDAGNPGGQGPPVVDMGAYEFRPGDCGHDGAVDMSDYAGWESCLLGPVDQTPAGCECFDVNGDDHVDLADFAVLQVNLTGP